jgi:hypothetical protein
VLSSPKPDQSEQNKIEDVVVCRDADGNSRERETDGKTLETSVEGKFDYISEVQATEYKKDTAEGHVNVEEVTGVKGVTVKFQRSRPF